MTIPEQKLAVALLQNKNFHGIPVHVDHYSDYNYIKMSTDLQEQWVSPALGNGSALH